MTTIPVIDVFAGPGGLGEGFSSVRGAGGDLTFSIRLSIERDATAHQTLELRAFFRRFRDRRVPDDYYRHVRGEITRESLFQNHSADALAARSEAWHHQLGLRTANRTGDRIAEALKGADTWVLLGGPPCQAYSLAGRSRNKGIEGYRPSRDRRQVLYVEYLQILAEHAPPVFIMENVKGLLSASLRRNRLFDMITGDLTDPAKALRREGRAIRRRGPASRYRLRPVVAHSTLFTEPSDFLVRAEDFGVPQARHRLIILGVREDINDPDHHLEPESKRIAAGAVLQGLPLLRSGLSKRGDSAAEWMDALSAALRAAWMSDIRQNGDASIREQLLATLTKVSVPQRDRGGEFLEGQFTTGYRPDWYLDSRIGGVLNHSTRGHMTEDLYRYLYAATFALVRGRSPELADFPKALLPAHRNVQQAMNGGYFADRFRVQVAGRPSTTITSHISKDGHYYIHPDPQQCRSLTVREAARLQTFPDNYFFCGGRTAQYVQVGNAVPPLLAAQVAKLVAGILR